MKFAFVAEHRETWPVARLCSVLGVSRQGFHAFLREPTSKRERAANALDTVVLQVFGEHQGRYGSPRVLEALKQEHALSVGKRRVEESMQRQGLFASKPRKFVVTTKADETYTHPPNILARDFTATRPDERWVTDITYLPSTDGWVYLAAILDLCTRKVVGWSMSDSLSTDLPLSALHMALAKRVTDLPLLHHSDRGCQYTSASYMDALKSQNITISMSRKGNCWDNAVAESFFATIKKELVHRKVWKTRDELESAVFEYIEAYYNRRRLHSALGYRTPSQVENEFLRHQQAA